MSLAPGAPNRRKRLWVSIAVVASGFVGALAIAASVMLHRAGPILKDRIVETLHAHFKGRVELGSLNVSVLRGLEVSGDRLRIYLPEGVTAAAAGQPLIAIERFSFHSGLTGLFLEPMHVGTVRVNGLQIYIPPTGARQNLSRDFGKHGAKVRVVVDEIVCEGSRLTVGTANPDKDPRVFELERIDLHGVGPGAPLRYDATLINAIPRGRIHAVGTFGPWQTASPAASPVTGHYTFDHADLNPLKGIGGVLSSVGDFTGRLDRIIVDGTTETPGFTLDTANHPLPLHTRFHAIVDGVTGDTQLEPVSATLGNSSFTTSGEVIDVKGHGHVIDLDVDIGRAPVQDFLDLAVKTEPAVLTGMVGAKARLHIRPGKERVAERLILRGSFTLQGIHFTNPKVQDKVDMLSKRAQGEPKEAKPGAPDVGSQMKGAFELKDGILQFGNLSYILPGARVNLAGAYSLDGEQFDFHGKVLTEASLSQMVDSPWLSLLLKVASPFFKKKGGGAEIPVSVSGVKSEPKFGLDVLKRHSGDKRQRAE